MKPKPLSIRRRFIALHVSTFALAVWLLAGAVYINLKIRREMEEPLKDLHAALVLNAEIDAAQQEVFLAAAQAYFHAGEGANKEFEAAAGKLPGLGERYSRAHLFAEERRALETLLQLQNRFVEYVNQRPGTGRKTSENVSQFQQVRDIRVQLNALQYTLAQAHLQRLEAYTGELHTYTRMLYVLLAALGLLAVLALWHFRRMHRREIWEPLAGLRRMVMQVRQGNLDVSASVPRSMEFGVLMSGFLDMAGKLREMRDSLEQKVRERTAKLEATQHELVQAAKLSSLGQLVSGVAHEINNPLTSILGFSELALARPELDSRLRKQLQTIREEAVRLRTLVANLNDFARRGLQRTARVDLRGTLDRLADLRRYQLSASNIELHYDRPPQPAWVEGDRDQLVQVFFNLVLNSEHAIQSCRSKGDIWLACGTDAGRAWATVRDNGSGMSPEIQERIFDPFFTTKPVGQATGLGLSISHGIIQQHHGTIAGESIQGQGTTMRITLPAADPPKDPASEPASEPAETQAVEQAAAVPGPRALIIEDEPAITQLVEHFLEGRGWECVLLNDSTAVEAVLPRQPFDLVICDLKMPGMNGLDVLRWLRQKRPELARRFLLMTGNLSDTRQEESVELAGVPVLRKPFTLARLAEAIATLLADQQ